MDVPDAVPLIESDKEKAGQKASKQQEREERAARLQAEREARKRLKLEEKERKALEKQKAGEQKAAATQVVQSEVSAAEEEVHTGDESIKQYAKMSTPIADRIGNLLLATKPKLKLLRPKKGFKSWIENDCKIKYRSASNYMAVASAIAKEPALRERGLTELYEVLGLVTRERGAVKKAASQNRPDGEAGHQGGQDSVGDDVGSDDDINGNHEDGIKPADITVGPLNALYRGGCYVIELEEDGWGDALIDAITDVENFETILRGRGVLLRLKTGAGQAE